MRWFLPISGCVGHKLAETFQMIQRVKGRHYIFIFILLACDIYFQIEFVVD